MSVLTPELLEQYRAQAEQAIARAAEDKTVLCALHPQYLLALLDRIAELERASGILDPQQLRARYSDFARKVDADAQAHATGNGAGPGEERPA